MSSDDKSNQGSADLYNEISQINSELINTRRELQKKNAELERLNQKLADLSVKDYLTGLFNRRYFALQAPLMAARSKRTGFPICMISIDINNFKLVNDRLGHAIGDQLLIYLAQCIRQVTRQGQDTAFRCGGDEFLIILEHCEIHTAQRIMDRLHALYSEASHGTTLASGIEMLRSPETQDDFMSALIRADQKMYADKESHPPGGGGADLG